MTEDEVVVLEDRATRILPSAFIKSTRMLGVKLGPRARKRTKC